MPSPYKIPPNNNKRKQKFSNCENDVERPQKTSKHDDKTVSEKIKAKNNLKGGDPNEDSIHGRDLKEQSFSSN